MVMFNHFKFMQDKWQKFGPLYLSKKRWLFRFLHGSGEILDVGCGIGNLVSEIAKKNFKVTGVDSSEEAIVFAREKFKREGVDATLVNSDIYTFKTNKKFDYVTCFDVLEHFEDDDKAIKQMYRFLKKNGKLIVGVPANMALWSKDDVEVGHLRRYDKIELEKKLANGGFKKIKIIGYGFPISYIYQKYRICRAEQYGSVIAQSPPKILHEVFPILAFLIDKILYVDDLFTSVRSRHVFLIGVASK